MEIRKFSQEVKKELGYYVYIYKDEDGRVTYVGMGQNDRVLAHRKGEAFILAYGMDKEQALAIEAVLIDLLKAMPDVPPKLTNKRRGDKNRIGCKVGMFPVSEIEEQLKTLIMHSSSMFPNPIATVFLSTRQ